MKRVIFKLRWTMLHQSPFRCVQCSCSPWVGDRLSPSRALTLCKRVAPAGRIASRINWLVGAIIKWKDQTTKSRK